MWRKRSDARLRLPTSGPALAGIGPFVPPLVRLLALVGLCLFVSIGAGCSLPQPPGPGGSPVSGGAICKTALSTVGTRYAYGGAHPSKGFDCSGLVSWAYAKNGVTVPRTASEQSSMGRSVSKGSLKPGDLVVFRIRSGLHTGIYTGKGRFVHSPRTGSTVREDSIDSKYWRGRFIAGRRHPRLY